MDKKPREMVKCAGCGGLHYADECETVVIKLIKGKACQISSFNQNSLEERKEVIFNGEVKDKTPVQAGEIKQVVIKKNIIPPGIMSLMIDPGSPHFESHGAKETRKT
jgi:hypothetical protein